MSNWWPFLTTTPAAHEAAGSAWTAAGPFVENHTTRNDAIFSVRPIWTQFEDLNREAAHYHFLYPLVNYYKYDAASHWHVLNLIRGAEGDDSRYSSLHVYPLYFSRQTGNPATSYRALWPVGGTLKNFFGRDRADFVAWPLFVRTRNAEAVRYSVPWPFFQYLSGPESSGWGVWPLYGQFERANRYEHTWAIWPLYYNLRDNLQAATPYERLGILPFYHRETNEGLRSETYGWPFFGYTKEWHPRPAYSEIRYFWPLLVQGRGDAAYVNRWMPFFTHERTPDTAKRWFLWPLLKRERVELSALTRQRTQLLFFLYWNEHQFNDSQDFSARRTYLWPLLGYANNGEGRRQLQLLDPFGPFFPHNEKVRENWSPLFSFYRYDKRPERTRHNLLWNFVVVENRSNDTSSLHVGPLFERVDHGTHGHWQILNGLVGRERSNGESRWSFLWNSF